MVFVLFMCVNLHSSFYYQSESQLKECKASYKMERNFSGLYLFICMSHYSTTTREDNYTLIHLHIYNIDARILAGHRCFVNISIVQKNATMQDVGQGFKVYG